MILKNKITGHIWTLIGHQLSILKIDGELQIPIYYMPLAVPSTSLRLLLTA